MTTIISPSPNQSLRDPVICLTDHRYSFRTKVLIGHLLKHPKECVDGRHLPLHRTLNKDEQIRTHL